MTTEGIFGTRFKVSNNLAIPGGEMNQQIEIRKHRCKKAGTLVASRQFERNDREKQKDIERGMVKKKIKRETEREEHQRKAMIERGSNKTRERL